jgi:hypothetical protein
LFCQSKCDYLLNSFWKIFHQQQNDFQPSCSPLLVYAENKTFLSLQQNGRLADYNNYNINKTPVLILVLTYHILGGLHQE